MVRRSRRTTLGVASFGLSSPWILISSWTNSRFLSARSASAFSIPATMATGQKRGRVISGVDDGEQHPLAPRLELEGDAAALSPGEGEFAWRIELGDPALQAMLFAKSFRPLAGRIGKLAIAPDELEWCAELHLHLTRRQPFAAQIALGEGGP